MRRNEGVNEGRRSVEVREHEGRDIREWEVGKVKGSDEKEVVEVREMRGLEVD